MKSPFTLIRGGQSEPATEPARYLLADRKQVIGDRIVARHLADRDRVVNQSRNQTKSI